MKTSDTKYVTIKNYLLYGAKAIPCGAVRETNGTKEAQFFLISGNNPQRLVWLRKEELM